MKTFNTYYENHETLQTFVEIHSIQDAPSLLIQVFTSENNPSYIQKLLNELTAFLPQAVIIGSTTDGEIMNGKVSTRKTVLSFTRFEHTQLKADAAIHQKNGYFSGQDLAKSLIREDTRLLIAFVDGLHTNGEAFLSGIDSVSGDVIVSGGLAGDNGSLTETYVFTKDHIIQKGAVAVSFSSHSLIIHNAYNFNWYTIGKELTVTHAADNRVYTINNKPATEIYSYYLGEEVAAVLPSIGIEFPLITVRNGIEVARTIVSKEDDGSLVFTGNLHTGEKVQFGYGNTLDLLTHAGDIYHQLQRKPSEAIFIYSCGARKHIMPDMIHKEIEPLQAIAPTSGFFTYGEFYTDKRKELLNQTMTIVSLSEEVTISESKTLPSLHTDSKFSIMDALTNLLNRTNQERMEEDLIALEKSQDGILVLENDTFLQCNQKILDMFGYSTTENFVKAYPHKLFPGKQPDGSYSSVKMEKMKALTKKNGSHQFECLNVKQNGEPFWVNIILSYRMINEKEIFHMVYRNVTDKKNQENENSFITNRMELALAGSKTAVLDWDFRDNSMYISPSWKEMLGFRDDELPNAPSSWFRRAHTEDKKTILAMLREHEKNKIRFFESNHRLKHKDGHWVWVLGRAQILFDENGKKVRMIGTHTDITKEKESQIKYFQQVQIMEQIHDGIVTTDLEGNVTSWNKGAEELFGYSQSEIIGKHISLIYRKKDIPGIKERIRASLEETGLYQGDLTFITKSKKIIPVSLSLSLLKDEHGNVAGRIGINQDITQRKKDEKSLLKAKRKAEESAKSKSEFLANMSHEIRTPLSAILGFIDLLKKENIEKKAKEYVDIIDTSSKGLLKIIEDILDFSKIESGKLEIDKIDFSPKIEFETIIHLFLAKCAEKDIALTLILDESLPETIHTDPLRIKQIISNLLSNAIKFTDQGKKITVTINYKNGFLNVSVKDEGKGIAKEKLSHIFESFAQEDSSTTREYGGTGLGLTISYRLVKILGGELHVKSKVGAGSEFYFSIKVSEGKDILKTKESMGKMTFDNKKVLLVEDVKTNQLFMSIILEGLHFEVATADNGIEAVEAFKQNSYDLILMDEHMPKMNGIEATKQILAIEGENNLPHTPIIALTANAIKGDRERFLKAGMDEYVTKPINQNIFVKVLRKVLFA
ncbi:PAS domain S-box protein [Sulfurovum sp. NBC37-1]|uniref:PAS domain S-box protein n=1 Tax=Sulfurovum sp. (strain NBC37-1) TaxID=387093 RepID=UPI0001587B78|nr:PAS domain S-box protein [Sulfurovum sp. NBC37-1]BAF72804.1 conserved hypothetical protein [Sulfurovum sp. NBC37-1]